jgi:aminopeptidase N
VDVFDFSELAADFGCTDTDLIHNDLDIEIFPSTQEIAGANTMTVAARVDGVTTFGVRIASTFAITAVTVNGAPAPWAWTVPGVEITVTLDRAYDAGETFAVGVAYDGPAVGLGFGSIVWASAGGRPWVYTLSETDFAYSWWPNKNDNTDKSTADLRFTIPDDVFLVSNGVRMSDTPRPGGRRTLHYRTSYPTATYLYQFSLGDYNLFSGSHPHAGGVMPLEFAILDVSDSQNARNAWLRTEDMLPVFDGLFGLYPFIDEKYGIYQFGFGGGMEHQTMTGQGTLSESVTAHELAHQWWGDMVTCATWNHIWLNEGFATYGEVLWLEYESGASDPAARIAAISDRTPSSVDGTVYVDDATDFNRIFSYTFSYLKGGWVVHMLRGVLGDQDFFATLADYRAAFEYGAATTEDLRAVAEARSGLDLGAFFDQWIYQRGAPRYRTSFAHVVAAGRDYADVRIEQTQSGSYPAFDMPVDLRFTTGAGPRDAVARNTARDQRFLVPLPAAPTSMTLDPDLWILKLGVSATGFVPGPPRIVAASPAPDAVLGAAPPEITLVFHRDVQIAPGDVGLVGDAAGAVPVSLAYDAPTMTATITPDVPLPAGVYTLTVDDAVNAAGAALDGEILGGALPSGDGLAGGDALLAFTVAPTVCAGDVNGDGVTNVFDFTELSANFGAGPGATLGQGDLTGDGYVDVFDFSLLAADFGCDLAP